MISGKQHLECAIHSQIAVTNSTENSPSSEADGNSAN